MPLYSYTCEKCQRTVEEFRSVETRNLPTQCDKCDGMCHKDTVAPHVKFIGSGFYVTDYTDYNVRTKWPKKAKQEMIDWGKDSHKKEEKGDKSEISRNTKQHDISQDGSKTEEK